MWVSLSTLPSVNTYCSPFFLKILSTTKVAVSFFLRLIRTCNCKWWLNLEKKKSLELILHLWSFFFFKDIWEEKNNRKLPFYDFLEFWKEKQRLTSTKKYSYNVAQTLFLVFFFLLSWFKLSKSLAQLVTVTSLKKLSFVCPKTSSSEACFHRMSEPQLSQCQHMNLGDLRFSISFCFKKGKKHNLDVFFFAHFCEKIV